MVYRSSWPSPLAYLRRTRDWSPLRTDAVWVLTGRGRPLWLTG